MTNRVSKIAKTKKVSNQSKQISNNTREKIFKILNVIIYGFGGLFLLIYLVIFAIEFFQSIGRPIFGYQFYHLGSGSMQPSLQVGDKILVQTTTDLEIGDIITYTEDDGKNFTTHRIVEINGNQIITKGDANIGNDDPIYYSNVMGKMIKKANLINIFLSIKYPIISIFAAFIILSLFLKK